MFGTLSGELRRATCPQVAVSPMLVLATRDVSRSYRLIRKGFTMPKAWLYIDRAAFFRSAAGLRSRRMWWMLLRGNP